MNQHFKEPFLHKYTWYMHIRTFERPGFFRSSDALKPSETGAAAHMSLHQSNNEKEPTAPHPSLRKLGDRFTDLERRVSNPENRVTAAGDRASMPTAPHRQLPISNFIAILSQLTEKYRGI
ncbi:hypothetical protein [Edaphosphingomonas haloaromaticamans]|uniref:hypothetical protein n=1 Tax=Edaphosphingomonas haloaromaticamans TaxID=653954 RepID=UPI000B31B9A3|nr:hypothetical protein [Sphingomonas haloaromaticamans]